MNQIRYPFLVIPILLIFVLLSGGALAAADDNTYDLPMSFKLVNKDMEYQVDVLDTAPKALVRSRAQTDTFENILKLPSSLETIGVGAFYQATSLKKVIIPEGAKEIRKLAFANTPLEEVVIPKTVTSIAEDAFSGCLFVKIIAEPGSYAYNWASERNLLAEKYVAGDFEYTIINGMCVITAYNGVAARVVIPETLNNMPVIRLAESAFSGNEYLQHVVVPSSVLRIDNLVFKDCVNLQSASLADSITHIGISAFYNCEKLNSINLPKKITRLEYDTFYGCSSLQKIVLPESITYLDEGVFYGCTNLKNINIPTNVTFLGVGVFYHCASLESVSIPEEVTVISDQLFNGCTSLRHIEIPGRVTGIGTGAFYNCPSLEEVILPDRLESIGYAAFYNCSKLPSISIPDQVTTIGDAAFYGCVQIKNIILPDGVVNIGKSLFYHCEGLQSVKLPSNLPTITEYMFTGCYSLKAITIPATVKEIGFASFNGCHSLSTVNVPQSVTSIKDYAFYYNNALKTINLDEGVASIGAYAFGTCHALTTINMPASVASISETAFSKTESVTMYGFSGSYAERYARQNHIPFVAFGLSDLGANEYTFIVDEENPVLFTVNGAISSTINLYSSESTAPCGLMHDDGRDGDVAANDGIYSLNLHITMDSAKIVQYYARSGSLSSNIVELIFFERPSDNSSQATQELRSIQQGLINIENQYSNDVNLQLNAAEEYAASLVARGLILDYDRTGDAVFIENNYGLTIAYIPEVEHLDSNNDSTMRIITFQPCLSTYSSDSSSYMTYPDDAARRIANTFDNYSFVGNYDDSGVTLSRIRGLGPNTIVLWHGHGAYYNSLVGSILVTGEAFDMDAWLWDPVYWWDCVQKRIVHNFTGTVSISGRYIDKYCGSMTNSFLYLAACESGYDSKLADSFLNKGATAVVANTETIYTRYNLCMMKSTMEYMCLTNANTANYYTLEEALSAAFTDNGINDVVWANRNTSWNTSGHNPAQPKIFGGNAAKSYRLADAYGTLSGTVKRADDGNTPIANASISIRFNDTLYRSAKTSSSGTYSISNLPPRQYKIFIEAPGYVPFTSYATINVRETTYMETFLMVEGQEGQRGTASGTITNALTGVNLSGVNLSVRQGWNNTDTGDPVMWGVSDSSGQYTFELPIGNYTVSASKENYIPSSFNIIVQPNKNTGNQNHAMSPTISNEQYRIKLTWSADPRDLDSHLQGQYSGGETFHVFYRSKNAIEGNTTVCNLDVDDTDGYGPEVTTLLPVSNTPYYYYIHRYAGSGTIASSSARIEVYRGSQHIRTFNVPTNLGSGDYWNVFAIRNGTIIVSNTSSTSGPDVSYAG